VDCLALPTTPTIYTIEQVRERPIELNAKLGRYTNFVNLLDLCAVATPAGRRAGNGLPFGISLIAPAGRDGALLRLGGRYLGEG
jgi:allophanate hydrolase